MSDQTTAVVTAVQTAEAPVQAVAGTVPVVAAADAPKRRRRKTSVNSVITSLAAVWILVVVVAALIPTLLVQGDPAAPDVERVLQEPGQTLLGADQYGRSVLGLLVHGARSAVLIGLGATVLALVVGTTLGLMAGYAGGWVDMLIGRLVDILMAFPGVLLALVIAAALGPTTTNLVIAVGIAAIPQFARVMRSQTMTVRDRLYVEAARASGYSQARIILRHILPNAIAPIVVLATLTIGVAIVLAASLSFLGLGPHKDLPDWGQLLAQGQPYLESAWWMSTFPGLAITLTVICLSVLGDSLSDKFEEG
ncbi:ABC transporter permease [Tessaracoccus sp. SD287]|uniref:ABC transporter permease n=1 Tax=Tessaracoccus sp. SD287 TaxID=2782008 RepID=UPI001A97BE4D|nr:ABC transporter permease [Tessaracoccus sp. SD287]MBO1030644.1 ABC transporter permease [Tessaracoccus sp. SD287]